MRIRSDWPESAARAALGLALGLALPATLLLSVPAASAAEAASPLRLETARSFAGGSIRFEPALSSQRFVHAKASMVRLARKELLPGTAVPTPEVFFAAFALETTARISTGPTKITRDVRSVWVVRFPRVNGERKTAVIVRANLPTVVPVTTIARRVTTDVLVVIDDLTGEVVLRSEFAPEESSLNRAGHNRDADAAPRPTRSVGP